jgi:DNA-binding HxlR family transcriptional regulator
VAEAWEQIDDHQCHLFQVSLELIGRRWSSAILLAMARGACRFSEIRACVPGLSDRMLAQRLRELETAGLVRRQVTPTMPVQVTYQLSSSGAELMASLQPLVRWGLRWHGQQDQERSAGLRLTGLRYWTGDRDHRPP